MSISLMDFFKIMNILVNFYNYEDILENFKVNIDSTKSEQNINELLSQFKKDVDNWYIKILIKSIVLCVLLIIFIYLISLFFNNVLIGTGFLSVVFVSIFYVFVYIVFIYNNKNKFKKNILNKAHDYVNKYGIHYESVYCY